MIQYKLLRSKLIKNDLEVFLENIKNYYHLYLFKFVFKYNLLSVSLYKFKQLYSYIFLNYFNNFMIEFFFLNFKISKFFFFRILNNKNFFNSLVPYNFLINFNIRNIFFNLIRFNQTLTFWSMGLFEVLKNKNRTQKKQEQYLRTFLRNNIRENLRWVNLNFYNFSKRIFIFLNIFKQFQNWQRNRRILLTFINISINTKELFGFRKGKKFPRRKRYLQRRSANIYF